jgi:isopenicillin N synthase-like dioxygenase
VHFGRDKNLLPSWIDLENTMMDFITHLDSYSVKLQSALSLFMDQKEDYLEEITQDGACLLRVYIIPKIPLQVDFEQLNILI